MLTLCIDTAYKYLACCLLKDDEIIAAFQEECFKKQSEQVFVVLDKLFKNAKVAKDAIDSIVITKGPGSYTGVRIAMTIAKVLSQVNNLKLYTLSSLQLYAGGQDRTMVIMDARANRAYVGIYDGLKTIEADCIKELSAIDAQNYNVVGDGQLIGKAEMMVDIAKAFLTLKSVWQPVEHIAYLTPEYLKESESYYR